MTFIRAGTTIDIRRNDAELAGSGRVPTAVDEYTVKDRVSGFLALVRPLFFILTPVNAASAAVLSLGGYPALSKCLLGFLAVAFASCAVNVFNDFIDRERDKKIWPARAIPSGRVRQGEALLLAIISLAISLTIAWLAFNPTTFYILLLAIALGGLYSAYLRDKVGYLSLPPIVGLIYLGGWAAFSPETLFGSFVPWYLYLLGVTWQAAHIMIYYPLHVVPDNAGVSTHRTPPALILTPSPRTAVRIGIVFTGLTLVLGVFLPLLVSSLGSLYLFMVIAAGICTLLISIRLPGNIDNRQLGLRAFTALSLFRLVISAAILLSVLIMQF